MKVAKFGGSSVANAMQIKKVGAIIKKDPKRKFIVVSAPGKRYKGDFKITDKLIDLAIQHSQNKPHENIVATILDRFSEIIDDLKIQTNIVNELEDSIQSILNSNESYLMKMDALKSLGEDNSAKILSEYLSSLGLNASYLNPKDAGILVSNEPGRAQILQESFAKLKTLRNEEGIFVIPGFFAYTKEGDLVTFSRGGSDITGSIVAAGVQADLYENFTDVDSVYAVNPTIVNQPKEILTVTYKEMRELSYAGFSVFHDEALIPAFKAGIPVCIKNTNNPDTPGTMIVSEKKPNEKCVVGIASDVGFCSLYVSKYLMNREVGFGRKLLQIFEDEGISFEHAPSGIDDMSVIIRQNQLTAAKERKILNRINDELHADMVKIHRNLAMVMVVGEGMTSTIGVAQKATTAIAEANVNVEMINQGSSEVSMMFGIQEIDINRAVQSLYTAFFES
ncbi:aspartate kinase [Virgibacillus ndiopensis]|uniref:aspartate kinase n=1 Tax=Virgibacillus ndiopensis TaxID=2004408 RepID=UPI000C06DF9A|nr:aspartate kinase [Virgibacillus ndiopensis]